MICVVKNVSLKVGHVGDVENSTFRSSFTTSEPGIIYMRSVDELNPFVEIHVLTVHKEVSCCVFFGTGK